MRDVAAEVDETRRPTLEAGHRDRKRSALMKRRSTTTASSLPRRSQRADGVCPVAPQLRRVLCKAMLHQHVKQQAVEWLVEGSQLVDKGCRQVRIVRALVNWRKDGARVCRRRVQAQPLHQLRGAGVCTAWQHASACVVASSAERTLARAIAAASPASGAAPALPRTPWTTASGNQRRQQQRVSTCAPPTWKQRAAGWALSAGSPTAASAAAAVRQTSAPGAGRTARCRQRHSCKQSSQQHDAACVSCNGQQQAAPTGALSVHPTACLALKCAAAQLSMTS